MVTKLKHTPGKQAAGAAGLFDSVDTAKLAGSVKDSAQQIWLAGMGAFSKAQAEGGKVFEALVKEGMNLQRKTQTVAEGKLSEVTHKMSGMASEVQARAGQQWDKLESIFEQRTAKALAKLGVPSAKDVAALSARMDELTALVGKGAAKAGKTAPVNRKPAKTAAKTAAKRPARRAV
jgi:poly(hydroxyalkanoate) granule-associated protein